VNDLLLAGLLVMLVILALIALQAADLLVAVLSLGAYGFAMSLIWAAMGAVDVAFTEAVVGAGATTIFFLATLLATTRRRRPGLSRMRWLGRIAAVLVAAAIAAVSSDLPLWDDPDAPSAIHVSPRYLEDTIAETATPNAVTAVLADYRSYDTLIETVVIVTAGIGCWLLLRERRPPGRL
jgi:multicomponent Na+:H+ antiporter subunit B